MPKIPRRCCRRSSRKLIGLGLVVWRPQLLKEEVQYGFDRSLLPVRGKRGVKLARKLHSNERGTDFGLEPVERLQVALSFLYWSPST
jgi:hypothetical protein